MDDSPPPAPTEAAQLAEWLGRVAETRDRAAFIRLFGHFAPRLKGYLIRLGCEAGTAEELVQDVMLAVWQRAGDFDPAQAGVATWIYTIARNRRIDRLRRERHPELDPTDPLLVPDPPDRIVETAEQEARVREALVQLPEEQAALVRLAFFDDQPHARIAEGTGLPLGTVKSRIRLALARLRRALGPDEGP